MRGLRIILDKSTVYGLHNEEIDSLDRYFFQIVPSILINEILAESLAHEREQLAGLHQLLKAVEGKNVWIEEFARLMIVDEEMHCSEVEKMLKQPPK